VAAACHRRAGIEVGVLFPDGGVAPRQAKQLTCWDDNIHSFAVAGSFDDCQRMVKSAFAREDWPRGRGLSSANSINVGRLLPQMAYYAIASLRYRHQRGREPGFIVPSGNIGNSVGAFWARKIGFPFERIALATNANRTVADWFEDGRWRPRPSVRTLANAMDVGDPSNMERLFDLYPSQDELRSDFTVLSVDDETIRHEIARGIERWGQIWCPHTATAVHLRDRLPGEDWIVVATAHPAKFDSIVEPLIGREVPVPPQLAALLKRPSRVLQIEADLDRVIECMP
jgi:threonine synthase